MYLILTQKSTFLELAETLRYSSLHPIATILKVLWRLGIRKRSYDHYFAQKLCYSFHQVDNSCLIIISQHGNFAILTLNSLFTSLQIAFITNFISPCSNRRKFQQNLRIIGYCVDLLIAISSTLLFNSKGANGYDSFHLVHQNKAYNVMHFFS